MSARAGGHPIVLRPADMPVAAVTYMMDELEGPEQWRIDDVATWDPIWSLLSDADGFGAMIIGWLEAAIELHGCTTLHLMSVDGRTDKPDAEKAARQLEAALSGLTVTLQVVDDEAIGLIKNSAICCIDPEILYTNLAKDGLPQATTALYRVPGPDTKRNDSQWDLLGRDIRAWQVQTGAETSTFLAHQGCGARMLKEGASERLKPARDWSIMMRDRKTAWQELFGLRGVRLQGRLAYLSRSHGTFRLGELTRGYAATCVPDEEAIAAFERRMGIRSDDD